MYRSWNHAFAQSSLDSRHAQLAAAKLVIGFSNRIKLGAGIEGGPKYSSAPPRGSGKDDPKLGLSEKQTRYFIPPIPYVSIDNALKYIIKQFDPETGNFYPKEKRTKESHRFVADYYLGYYIASATRYEQIVKQYEDHRLAYPSFNELEMPITSRMMYDILLDNPTAVIREFDLEDKTPGVQKSWRTYFGRLQGFSSALELTKNNVIYGYLRLQETLSPEEFSALERVYPITTYLKTKNAKLPDEFTVRQTIIDDIIKNVEDARSDKEKDISKAVDKIVDEMSDGDDDMDVDSDDRDEESGDNYEESQPKTKGKGKGKGKGKETPPAEEASSKPSKEPQKEYTDQELLDLNVITRADYEILVNYADLNQRITEFTKDLENAQQALADFEGQEGYKNYKELEQKIKEGEAKLKELAANPPNKKRKSEKGALTQTEQEKNQLEKDLAKWEKDLTGKKMKEIKALHDKLEKTKKEASAKLKGKMGPIQQKNDNEGAYNRVMDKINKFKNPDDGDGSDDDELAVGDTKMDRGAIAELNKVKKKVLRATGGTAVHKDILKGTGEAAAAGKGRGRKAATPEQKRLKSIREVLKHDKALATDYPTSELARSQFFNDYPPKIRPERYFEVSIRNLREKYTNPGLQLDLLSLVLKFLGFRDDSFTVLNNPTLEPPVPEPAPKPAPKPDIDEFTPQPMEDDAQPMQVDPQPMQVDPTDTQTGSTLYAIQHNLSKLALTVHKFINSFQNKVIYGPPGVGKTQTARMILHLRYGLGIDIKIVADIDSGNAATTGYTGQSSLIAEKDTNRLIGACGFYDEVYGLIQGTNRDFGIDYLSVLNNQLNNPMGMITVIFAGYDDKTRQVLDTNEGLKRRFDGGWTLYAPSEFELKSAIFKNTWLQIRDFFPNVNASIYLRHLEAVLKLLMEPNHAGARGSYIKTINYGIKDIMNNVIGNDLQSLRLTFRDALNYVQKKNAEKLDSLKKTNKHLELLVKELDKSDEIHMKSQQIIPSEEEIKEFEESIGKTMKSSAALLDEYCYALHDDDLDLDMPVDDTGIQEGKYCAQLKRMYEYMWQAVFYKVTENMAPPLVFNKKDDYMTAQQHNQLQTLRSMQDDAADAAKRNNDNDGIMLPDDTGVG